MYRDSPPSASLSRQGVRDFSQLPCTIMDDQDRYRPSEDAKALAQAMMPPPGALPGRPVRNPKHKRGASFGGIPFVQLESLQSWTLQESRDNMVMAWKTAAADAV
ncbi:hypothetical protein MRX96_014327 [Rhipicephalus microplus]